MATRETPRRTIRISDELWNQAKDAAEANGDEIATVIRQALDLYVKWAGRKPE